MLILNNEMLLYHGSFTPVSQIKLNKCKQGKDFGRGFYVTSFYKQAQSFVPLSINKQISEGNLSADSSVGYISVYRLHLTPEIQIHTFPVADKNWLHFVATNRRKVLFPEIKSNMPLLILSVEKLQMTVLPVPCSCTHQVHMEYLVLSKLITLLSRHCSPIVLKINSVFVVKKQSWHLNL